jgi:hypothetical protein
MSNMAENMELCEAILGLIEQTRIAKCDATIGARIERFIVDSQFAEIEREILENPGAIEPWLVRRRREN